MKTLYDIKKSMLPFFTSEKPFKLFPQSVDGMKCEVFWLENVERVAKRKKNLTFCKHFRR